MMYSLRAGVFLPMKNSSARLTSPIEPGVTRFMCSSSAMNCLNSFGEISPRPLNRVTSLFLSRLTAALRSASE